MNTIQRAATVTALSSIAHGGESAGTVQLFRREKFVLADGSVESLPCVSGNSIRGALRDAGMAHMCETLGLTGNLSLPAFDFLFSGGTLGKDGSKALRLDEARKVTTLIPLVSVLGGSTGNQIMSGKASIGKMVPICSELAHLLPGSVATGGLPSVWDLMQRESYTRRDDKKRREMRVHMSDAANATQDASEDAARDRHDKGSDEPDEQKTQMRYHVETMCAGTRYYWRINLMDVSDLEWSAFVAALAQFASRPVIGGKSNVGMGLVKLDFGDWLRIDPTEQLGEALTPHLDAVKAHYDAHAADIRAMLEGWA